MEEIYEMIGEGVFNDYNGFTEYVDQNGIDSVYEMIPSGVFNDKQGFLNYASTLNMPEKKNPIVTDSNGQTEVTESTTQMEEIPGSSDGLEVNKVVEEGVISGEELIEDQYIDKDLESLMDIDTSTDVDFNPAMSGRARMMRQSTRQVDPVKKQKILSDYNISKALELGIIDDNIIDSALKGNKNSIKKIQELSAKRPEFLKKELEDKNLTTPFAYEQSSTLEQSIVTPEDTEAKLIEDPNYKPTGYENSDVDSMYDVQKLKNIKGLNLKDFDGYLNEQGFKEEYLRLLEDEVISEEDKGFDYFNQYTPSLAAEKLKLRYLTNYINNQVERNVESQVLNYKLENNGKHPSLDGIELSFKSGVDDIDLTKYIEEELPIITSKLKERDVKNQELYQEMKDGEVKGLGQAFKQGWRSIEDRIASFSAGTYDFFGADNIAEKIRMSKEESELDREDFMRYAYASGKEANVNNTNYLIDDKGQIYDTDLGLRVTDVLSLKEQDKIKKQVEENGKESSTFSKTGVAIQGTGIATDMLLQIALTRGVGNLGQGIGGALSLTKTGGKAVGLMSKIPMKATTASAMIAQGTLFATNLSEQARQQALDGGLSVSQAEEISSIAGSQGLALGVLTAPLSTQTVAMDKIFGKKDVLLKGALNAYQKAGAKGAKKYFDSALQKAKVYATESSKEVFQENVQQAGQAYVIGDNVNDFAKKEIMANTISSDEFKNTTILSAAAGFFMPFAGDVSSNVKTSFKSRFKPGMAAIDKMNSLYLLSKDVDKTTNLLNSQVSKGVYTEEQVKSILSDVELFRSTINSIPTNLTPETSLNVMKYINEINKQKSLKEQRDPAFHPEIDARINDLRNEIISISNFDFVNKKGKAKLKEEASKELTEEAQSKGEKDFTIDNDAITQRAIDNFNQMENDEKLTYTDLKTEKDAIQEPSTEKQMLQDDAGSKEEGRDSELGLQQVGEGDVGQVSTETEVETSKTETDKTSDTTTQGDTEQVDMSVNKGRVDSIVDGIIEKTKGRNTGESTNPNKVANNAIEYLKGSKLFEQSNDVERETILRDVSKRLGIEIKPPTAKKLLGIKRIGKPTTIKVRSDYAELKKDLRKEQKIARDAKNDVNKRRKGLQGSIDAVLKAGNITTKKANTLLKKVSNVNLYNAQKVQDVIDFTERAMNDAEYSNKLEKANKLQKAIKTTLKGKEAGLSDASKEFAKVNPSNVSDIDGYLEKAESVRKGLQPTRKPSKGDLKVTKPFDIKKITEYSKKEVDAETERNYQLAKESFQELTGLDAGELTLEDMRDMIANSSVEEDIEYDNKSKEIDKAVVNAFKNTKINIKGAIERGEISLTKSQKELINNFLNIDLSLLSTKAKMRALDSIINFELNQSTGGMESALEQYKGNKETTALLNKDIKANEKSSFIGGRWNKYISTLPNAFELIFKSQQKAQMFMKAIGIEGVINGSAKAEKEGSVVEEKYAKDFGKKKMKDGIYFDESNDTQRAILADIRRFSPGTEAEQQKEFEDSKNLVKETYEELLQSSDKIRKRKGEIIKEQYEKILKDSKTISDVESKVDPVNLEGVKYVTENIWAKKYDELSEVSLNVYNKNLGKDINYTPRNYQKLDDKVETPDITKPVFNPDGLSRKNAYDKKTGVLKEAKKLSSLPKGRVLNLSFDSQNMRNYKAALTDIYTASSIQKIKGARDSKAYSEILSNPEAKQVINDRINNYVDAKRGNTYLDKQNKRALRRLNKLSTLGVRAVLGGPTQVLKQLVPLSNTAVNAGPVNTAIGTKLIFNKEVKEAINNSGLPIANRGIKSQSDIDGLDSKISKKAKTIGGNILDRVDNLNKQTIELFLVSPDVAAARASFIAYYIKDIQKQGKKVGDIDWTKPLDKKAAQYAQQQVDRQQNASDQDLQGDLFTNQNAGVQILRKTVFPFANFLLNQKTRMYSDINTLVRNPTALPGDKTRAAKSLGGLAVETVTFNAIGLAVTQLLSGIAGSFSGEDEDPNLSTFDNYMKNEAEKDKQFKNRVRGRSGNMLADIISPIPILNDYMLSKANILLGLMQEGDDDPFKFFAKTDKKLVEQLGVLGIGGKKIDILKDMILAASTGEVSSEYMGKKSVKKITDKSRDKMKQVAAMYALHLLGVPGLNFSEVGYMSERAFKNLSKMKERELKYDIESDAVDRLKKRGISRPSEESIKNEMRNIRRENKGVNKKSSNKTFKPKSFGSGKSKSKSFNPKSF